MIAKRNSALVVGMVAGAVCFSASLPRALAQLEVPDAAPKKARSKSKAPAKPAPAPMPDPGPREAAPAAAGDAPAAKVDAKALVQSGVKLLKQKDYLGALAVFRDAYQRFPSVKLLLNIGTTLKLLGRSAEAANAYQRYLDDPEADPARVSEVGDVLATLDRVLGRISLSAAAPSAPSAPTAPSLSSAPSSEPPVEVSINRGEWQPLAQARLVRVDPGAYVVAARAEGYAPVEQRGQIGAGESAELRLTLALLPRPAARGGARDDGAGNDGDASGAGSLRARAQAERGRSRLGLMLRGHFHLSPAGAAALVGPTVDVTDRLEVNAGVLLGRYRGGYLGGSFAVLPGRFRPLAAAGLLIVADEGARFAARGAVGLEVVVSPNLSVFAELGGEHLFNPPMTVFENAFVPSAGVFGRL